VTSWATAVKTLGWSSSVHQRGKKHYWQCPIQAQLAVSTTWLCQQICDVIGVVLHTHVGDSRWGFL